MADRSRALLFCAVLAASPVDLGSAQDANDARAVIYRAATLDADGQLVITTADGVTSVVPKRPGQRSWGTPVLSDDRRVVGVQEFHPNCCTSYDLPLALVVFSGATTRRFTGNGLPIFTWHFADRGTRIAYGQEPAHFGCAVHYELREIASERLLDSAEVPQPCADRQSPPAGEPPQWVSALRARR